MIYKTLKSVSLILLATLFLAGCRTKQDDPAPPPSPSPEQSPVIPGSGGVVSGDSKTDYTFTPDSTTVWRFDVTEDGDGGITLKVFDPDDNSIGHSTTELSWVYMQAGITYRISMDVWTYAVGNKNSYTLTISPAGSIPDKGGEVQVDSEARYIFTPDRSGPWTFSTNVTSGDGEPMVWIWDIVKDYEVGINSEAGERQESMTLELTAETIYSVNVAFWLYETGNYTLTISPASP